MAERGGGWSGDDEFDDFDWTEPPPRKRPRTARSETGEGESIERESPEREALERELGLPVEGQTDPYDLGEYPSPEARRTPSAAERAAGPPGPRSGDGARANTSAWRGGRIQPASTGATATCRRRCAAARRLPAALSPCSSSSA